MLYFDAVALFGKHANFWYPAAVITCALKFSDCADCTRLLAGKSAHEKDATTSEKQPLPPYNSSFYNNENLYRHLVDLTGFLARHPAKGTGRVWGID